MITVKRAYLELEREGVIVTQQGKGSHVASTPGLGARLREQELEQHLEQAARIASQLGIPPKELEERLREAGDRVRRRRRNSYERSRHRSRCRTEWSRQEVSLLLARQTFI